MRRSSRTPPTISNAAQVPSQVLGRHRGVFPSFVVHRLTRGTCSRAKTRFAYAPDLVLVDLIAQDHRAHLLRQALHEFLNRQLRLCRVLGANFCQEPTLAFRQETEILDIEVGASHLFHESPVETL